MLSTVKMVDPEMTELEGPYECLSCGGHMMLDVSYLDQVDDKVNCPYCSTELVIPEEVAIATEVRKVG